jgi:uncharacterized protein YybS (DUF2232 family)
MIVALQMPLIGLPMTAAGASLLAYRGRLVLAIAGIAVGVASIGMLASPWLAYAIPAATAVVIVVVELPKRNTQTLAGLFIVLMMFAAVASDALSASLTGLSLIEALRSDAAASAKALTSALGPTASQLGPQIELARAAIVTLWPGFYFQTALFAGVLVVAAAAWGARRVGIQTRVPAMRDLDLSVHVLWGLLASLVLLAAGQVVGDGGAALRSAGLNLLYCTRALFFLQGLAVFSAIFDVPKTGRVKMIGLYLVLWLLDQVLLVVSLVGMVDFWMNFRHLPRDGGDASGLSERPSAET